MDALDDSFGDPASLTDADVAAFEASPAGRLDTSALDELGGLDLGDDPAPRRRTREG